MTTSITITKEVYNYLLPVYGLAAKNKNAVLFCRNTPSGDEYSIICTVQYYKEDVLLRLRYLEK